MNEYEGDDIYKMKLHDEIYPNTNAHIRIIRVAGGWIYIFFGESNLTSTFVPYNNEF